MSERTRANTDEEGRTVTDVTKESGGPRESAKTPGVDAAAESGYRPGDQVTEEMMESTPVDQTHGDRGGAPEDER